MVEAAGTVDDHALLLLPAQLHLLEDALRRAQEHLPASGGLDSIRMGSMSMVMVMVNTTAGRSRHEI